MPEQWPNATCNADRRDLFVTRPCSTRDVIAADGEIFDWESQSERPVGRFARERITALVNLSVAGAAVDDRELDNCRVVGSVTGNFGIEVESYTNSYTVVRLRGEFDMTSRSSLEYTLADVRASSSTVVTDLSGVTFMYSGAAAVLLDAADSDDAVQLSAPSRSASVVLAALTTDLPHRRTDSSRTAA